MLSLGPLLSDKLSSRLRGQDRPNCLTQKELPFEAIGIADARPTPVGPTREGSKPVKRSTGRGKPVAPTFECVDAYASLFDTNKNSRVYASTYFAQPGSSFMRLFERQKKLIDPQAFSAAPWGARVLVAIVVCLLAAGATLADGNKHKLSKDLDALRGGHNAATVDVIVQYNVPPTDVQHQKAKNKGGVLKTKLDVIKGAHYSVPVGSLQTLAEDPDVAYISPNRPLSRTSTLDYTPETVNAPVAWQQWRLDGSGVGVAVIDSGVTAVGDLYWWNPTNQTYGSRVVYSQNFVPGATDASDQYGHGTHVAGIIASEGWFSTGSNFTHTFKGIAPNANIINLRVLDQTGAGSDSSVIAAIQTVFATGGADGIVASAIQNIQDCLLFAGTNSRRGYSPPRLSYYRSRKPDSIILVPR